jgi:hypothetical protein
MTREEAEEQLTGIARGKAVKIGDQLLVATYSERIKAIAQISKMRGWEAVSKIDMTTNGKPINALAVNVSFSSMSK